MGHLEKTRLPVKGRVCERESLKADWSWAASQRLISTDEQSGLLMRSTATERVSLCVREKLTAFSN